MWSVILLACLPRIKDRESYEFARCRLSFLCRLSSLLLIATFSPLLSLPFSSGRYVDTGTLSPGHLLPNLLSCFFSMVAGRTTLMSCSPLRPSGERNAEAASSSQPDAVCRGGSVQCHRVGCGRCGVSLSFGDFGAVLVGLRARQVSWSCRQGTDDRRSFSPDSYRVDTQVAHLSVIDSGTDIKAEKRSWRYPMPGILPGKMHL